MAPKKGLSVEEKRTRLLNWFNLEHAVYNLKEIESIASKKTGISSMQIKEILDMLIADGLVKVQKCGVLNVYWNFKYENKLKLTNDFNKLNEKLEVLRQIFERNREYLRERKLSINDKILIDGEEVGRSILEKEEESKLKELHILKVKYEEINGSNLEDFEMMKTTLELYKEKLEVITENIEILAQYFVSQSNYPSSEIRKEFNLPEEFDELKY